MVLRLFMTDLDGTAVQYGGPFQSTWDAIGAHLPPKDAEAWIAARDYYLPRQKEWDVWHQVECDLLRGRDAEAVFSKVLPPPYTPGFKECMTALKRRNVIRGILSSGVDHIAHYIAHECELDFVVANELHVERGLFTGTGVTHVHMDKKEEWAKKIMRKYRIRREETAHCGDHFNDVPAWGVVGIRLGMNLKKPDLENHVDAHVTDFFQAQEYLARHF